MRIASIVIIGALALSASAQEKPDPTLLHEDQSWTHIGDGNFSSDSNAAGDMTFAVDGGALELVFPFPAESRLQLIDPVWTCVVFSGEVIGNDVGRIETVEPTRVLLDGEEVGTLRASGSFRILIPLKHFVQEKEHYVLRIESGQNGPDDRDDQELGMFRLQLSREALPAEAPADDGPER